MRTRWKVLSLILTMVMIISSFTFVVSADSNLIDSGSAVGCDWSLYSDGLLYIDCYFVTTVDLTGIDSEILNKTNSVKFDISGRSNVYLNFIGDSNYQIEKLYIVADDDAKVSEMEICDFPYVNEDNIFIPNNLDLSKLTLINVGITTTSFLQDFDCLAVRLENCDRLEEFAVSDCFESVQIRNCSELYDVELSSAVRKAYFYNLPQLTECKLPENVSRVSFYDCALEEISIPKSVKEISLRSDTLKKAVFENGVVNTGYNAFGNTPNLSEVVIPDSVTTIGYRSFYCCKNLKSVNLPSSVKDISSLAFYGSGLETFTIPSSVINIEYKVFANCKNLKSITIPTSIECVDASAFTGCTALTDVYYQGTEAQWNQIMFDPEDVSVSKIFNNATIHFNVKSGWSKSGDTWYYYDETGSLAKGWKQIKGEWYYFDTAGKMLTGWQQTNGKWYFLDDEGAMAKGWTQIKGKWYYLDSEGAMKTGWYQSGSSWYYLNSDGDMATGWKSISGKWYYFADGGEMATGWKSIGGKWYYFADNGDMKTGWVEDDGDWYYMKSDGSMARSEYCDGYWLNSAGIWSYKYKANWYKNDNGWWYGDDSGWYAKNETLIIDGVSYDFDGNGYMK